MHRYIFKTMPITDWFIKTEDITADNYHLIHCLHKEWGCTQILPMKYIRTMSYLGMCVLDHRTYLKGLRAYLEKTNMFLSSTFLFVFFYYFCLNNLFFTFHFEWVFPQIINILAASIWFIEVTMYSNLLLWGPIG